MAFSFLLGFCNVVLLSKAQSCLLCCEIDEELSDPQDFELIHSKGQEDKFRDANTQSTVVDQVHVHHHSWIKTGDISQLSLESKLSVPCIFGRKEERARLKRGVLPELVLKIPCEKWKHEASWGDFPQDADLVQGVLRIEGRLGESLDCFLLNLCCLVQQNAGALKLVLELVRMLCKEFEASRTECQRQSCKGPDLQQSAGLWQATVEREGYRWRVSECHLACYGYFRPLKGRKRSWILFGITCPWLPYIAVLLTVPLGMATWPAQWWALPCHNRKKQESRKETKPWNSHLAQCKVLLQWISYAEFKIISYLTVPDALVAYSHQKYIRCQKGRFSALFWFMPQLWFWVEVGNLQGSTPASVKPQCCHTQEAGLATKTTWLWSGPAESLLHTVWSWYQALKKAAFIDHW